MIVHNCRRWVAQTRSNALAKPSWWQQPPWVMAESDAARRHCLQAINTALTPGACACSYVCMYMCMHVRMQDCACMCACACAHICVCLRPRAHTSAHMVVHMHLSVYVRVLTGVQGSVHASLRMYVCVLHRWCPGKFGPSGLERTVVTKPNMRAANRNGPRTTPTREEASSGGCGKLCSVTFHNAASKFLPTCICRT